MVIRRLRAPSIDFDSLRRELDLPSRFPLAVLAEADATAGRPLPGSDLTGIPFVTIDPVGSRDLDQAVHLARRTGGGYRVHYAIADVGAYVRPGGDVDAEAWRRGQTVYLPDAKVPLHPISLSEGAASLLPELDRAAVVWTIDLAADGATTAVRLERARIRSRAMLNYPAVQHDADAGRLPDPIALLPEIGRLLLDRGHARGAIDLPMPEQEVEADGDGWRLVLRALVPVEQYNAQISLLTGMAAASLMLDGGIGLLRTMPSPRPEAVAKLRVAGAGLGIDWPDGATVGAVIASIDPAEPRAAAFLDHAAELMRGAGYTAFDGKVPDEPAHGAVAAPYAHVTAPLRRLADRYATEVCLALMVDQPVPDWAREALPKLPRVMASTDRTSSAAERGAVDLVEAVLLADRVGETFEAAVLDVDAPPRPAEAPPASVAPAPAAPAGTSARLPGGTIALADPPVRARCDGALPLGEHVRVRLVLADPVQRKVRFERD
ncbi:MAG TPA: RNB domain-containing ribonuclease [Pilimelia sp.]|nr:RNB domain-containing ribonuclease [Pilimelia sp.]